MILLKEDNNVVGISSKTVVNNPVVEIERFAIILDWQMQESNDSYDKSKTNAISINDCAALWQVRVLPERQYGF